MWHQPREDRRQAVSDSEEQAGRGERAHLLFDSFPLPLLDNLFFKQRNGLRGMDSNRQGQRTIRDKSSKAESVVNIMRCLWIVTGQGPPPRSDQRLEGAKRGGPPV